MSTMNYGKLIDRIKAVMIDAIVIAMFGASSSVLLSSFENVPDSVRIILFVFIFLLYDPIFTSFIGGTIGHLVIGLRVRNAKDETRKVIFPLAILRFIVKAFLGWISLVTVTSNKQNKAIHDSLVGSVVINVSND